MVAGQMPEPTAKARVEGKRLPPRGHRRAGGIPTCAGASAGGRRKRCRFTAGGPVHRSARSSGRRWHHGGLPSLCPLVPSGRGSRPPRGAQAPDQRAAGRPRGVGCDRVEPSTSGKKPPSDTGHGASPLSGTRRGMPSCMHRPARTAGETPRVKMTDRGPRRTRTACSWCSRSGESAHNPRALRMPDVRAPSASGERKSRDRSHRIPGPWELLDVRRARPAPARPRGARPRPRAGCAALARESCALRPGRPPAAPRPRTPRSRPRWSGRGRRSA